MRGSRAPLLVPCVFAGDSPSAPEGEHARTRGLRRRLHEVTLADVRLGHLPRSLTRFEVTVVLPNVRSRLPGSCSCSVFIFSVLSTLAGCVDSSPDQFEIDVITNRRADGRASVSMQLWSEQCAYC